MEQKNRSMFAPQSLLIYYFSGTGNSRNVARWFADEASNRQIPSRLVNIARTDRMSIPPPDPGALVAFVSPIHGFNYAPVMMYFIMRFPRVRNAVCLLNTRAGMRIGRWVTPGLTGVAFYLASIVLMLKGYSIRAMVPVDLPSNWLSLHPGLNERTVRYLHERNREKVARFAQKIFSGRRVYTALRDIVQDALIAPISLGYYCIGRFVFAKTFYASAACDRCDVCIKNCPVKAIRVVDDRPYWTLKCESCMRCMCTCPRRAIETGHGFIACVSAAYALVMYGISGIVMELLPAALHIEALGFVARNFLFFLILAAAYRLVHYSMRVPFIGRVMVWTSLTSYQFWGRRYRALND
ncbi:MAG TPA: EFR1 family ferrodoxin [Bacteroidota bacterium]|nr:EFR1 family ferrodoxin [Bacteroidota bacterium]